MEIDEAARLIAPAVAARGGTWADLGAGRGTLTRALATLLGESGRVIAVERDGTALRALTQVAERGGADEAAIEVVRADFTTLPRLPLLDGALLANALHFVEYALQERVLEAVARCLKPDGRLALVEYEHRDASRWVPYPVSFDRFVALAHALGLDAPVRSGERHSRYGGTLYSAYLM